MKMENGKWEKKLEKEKVIKKNVENSNVSSFTGDWGDRQEKRINLDVLWCEKLFGKFSSLFFFC